MLYLGGTALFFTSTFVVFGAMSLAPASILAPIESVQFVANVAFARCVNKQHISAAGYISSLVIVGGISMAVASGSLLTRYSPLTYHLLTTYLPLTCARVSRRCVGRWP